MEIECDPDQAAVNPLSHDGVTFTEAQAALLDPQALMGEYASTGDPRGQVAYANAMSADFVLECAGYAGLDLEDAMPTLGGPALAQWQVD